MTTATPLMIDATELKVLVDAADSAWQVVIKEDQRLVALKSKRDEIPSDPADKLACSKQEKVVDEAKQQHAFITAELLATTRKAIIAAEGREGLRTS